MSDVIPCVPVAFVACSEQFSFVSQVVTRTHARTRALTIEKMFFRLRCSFFFGSAATTPASLLTPTFFSLLICRPPLSRASFFHNYTERASEIVVCAH